MVCETFERARANAVKFLLYYDVDDTEEINIQKKAYIERIGSECVAEDIPFFLEVLTYDDNILTIKVQNSLKLSHVKLMKQ